MHRSGSIRLHRQAGKQRAPALHAQVLVGAVSRHVGAALRPAEPGSSLEEIEIKLLLDGIRLSYGYDFREYALSPLKRAVTTAMAQENVRTVSSYQDRVLHNAACMRRLLGLVGVGVTSMFRDADLIRAASRAPADETAASGAGRSVS